jgi:hypothetical protein
MASERPADFLDTIGPASRKLFARHRETGHRITSRRFYRDLQGGTYERQGYVLMTTAKQREASGNGHPA